MTIETIETNRKDYRKETRDITYLYNVSKETRGQQDNR